MRHLIVSATCVTMGLLWGVARGQVITFEQNPAGATPIDNSFLAAPYAISGGTVAFFFDVNGNNTFDPGIDERPVFEATGPDGSDGFANGALAISDQPYAGFESQLGDFFLRPLQAGSVPDPFVVDYNTTATISALSGEIWDIDGSGTSGLTEEWRVDVLDASGGILATQFSPVGTTPTSPLDGRPWTFAFTGLPAGVDKVRLRFIGTKASGVGLAFNNFSPTEAVPEPSSVALVVCGVPIVFVGWLRHRSRR